MTDTAPATTDPTASAPHSGLDLAALDGATRPQDDLYRHVNGKWLREHVIPADRATDGAFRALFDQAEIDVRTIIEEMGAQPDTQIGALYASFLNEARAEELRYSPLSAPLSRLADAADLEELATVLGDLQQQGGPAVIGAWVDTDRVDPEKYVTYLTQAGLGLPDEAYYREEQHEPIRKAYLKYVANVVREALPQFDANEAAQRLLALETALAAQHWDVVKDREATLTYNPTTLSGLAGEASEFDWFGWAESLGVPEAAHDSIVVRQPSYVTGFASLWASLPIEDWKLWAQFHLVRKFASYLHAAAVDENFDFYARTLTGTQQNRERWQRGVSLVEGGLGDAVGQVYVERHFPPANKQLMEVLVSHLTQAYRESISVLDWMGEETRARALEKLEAFTPKIGYPDKWRDYSALELKADDLVGNVMRSNAFDYAWEFAKIGKPLDRDEWFMTPQTVNAYYNPGMNEIVFPAAILQAPFFDPEAEDAVNFGGIGAVIGHEIGHGFDDQGSQYDGQGKLQDWWTAADRAEFEKRTAALIAQYDVLVPEQLGADGVHVNGALTIGENIGDLGGLAIALKAYAISLGGSLDDAPVIDGLTGVQRVFLGWAQVWQTAIRDEALEQRIATDPHSPAEFRCNSVARNLQEFHDAFNVQPGDALYLDPAERVQIW